MNILINFAQIKSGGGQNVAMNFLHGLEGIDLSGRKLFFVAAKHSAPFEYLATKGKFKFCVSPRNPIFRVIFELIYLPIWIRKNKIQIVYTYFGSSFICNRIKQICGSADSNIYYPEINFWVHYKGLSLVKKRLIDAYRIWGVKRADAVIFENASLLDRGVNLFKIRNVKFIRPSIALIENGGAFEMPKSVPKESFKILFLCGWQLNKNIMLIPSIARALKDNFKNFHVLLTAPNDNCKIHRAFEDELVKHDVSSFVSVVGQVPKDKLRDLYYQVDVVLLLSKLESFSNNIIESWCYGKPIIVAREEWAKSICGDAAVYVERDSVPEIAEAILEIFNNENLRNLVIAKGHQAVKDYPTIHERIKQELEYVEYIQNKD